MKNRMSRSTPSPSNLFSPKASTTSSDFLATTTANNTTLISVQMQQQHHAANYHNEEFQKRALCCEIVQTIKRLSIKLVAFDFDQTIVSIHTGGIWTDSADKLVEFVRPCFRHLLFELIKYDDLHIAVVTFSPQKELIKSVLRILIPNE
jgi:hypothetical protein